VNPISLPTAPNGEGTQRPTLPVRASGQATPRLRPCLRAMPRSGLASDLASAGATPRAPFLPGPSQVQDDF
jgi:hypothetical protein